MMNQTRQLSQMQIDNLLQMAAARRQGGPFAPTGGPVSAGMMSPGMAGMQSGLPPQAMSQGLPPQAMAAQMNPMMGGMPGQGMGGQGQGPGAGFDPEKLMAYAKFVNEMRNQQTPAPGMDPMKSAYAVGQNPSMSPFQMQAMQGPQQPPGFMDRLRGMFGGMGGMPGQAMGGQGMPMSPGGQGARGGGGMGGMPGQAMPKAMPGP